MEEQKIDKRQDSLRQKIMSIQTDKTLTPQEKAFKMQQLMMPEKTKSKQKTTGCVIKFNGHFGCEHYERGALMKAKCCDEFIVCRLCHNNNNTHDVNRYDIDEMMCSHCDTIQVPAQSCVNCKEVLGEYYCDKCHFWDNDISKHTFHCDDCNLCRSGKREDYYHCEVCDTCMNVELRGKHPCLEKTSHSDCPICNELLFTSIRPLTLMNCGHAIHLECLESYLENNYQCPYCLSSIADMTEFFERMEDMVKDHQMPEEYQSYRAEILCNDCHAKETMQYHFVGHKCGDCNSWNTRVTRTWKENTTEDED